MLPPVSQFELGEQAIVLQVSYGSTAECAQAVGRLYAACRHLPGIRSVRPSMDRLALEFESPETMWESVRLLHEREAHSEPATLQSRALRVPVCYEEKFAPDLHKAAHHLNMDPGEIVRLHADYIYEVWMIGFMPGFPYMGELNPLLRLPRKDRPDPRIPAGSVAIAEEFVGIYPFESPGGWHVIGRTPLSLVDYARTPPCLFDYGMRVKFESVSAQEFEEIQRGVQE